MRKGIYLALATAVISGFAIFFAKISVSVSEPVVFTTLKNALVALLLSFFLFKKDLVRKLKKLSKKDWGSLLLIGVVGGSFPFALFFTGLQQTAAINAAMIHKTLYIWVAFLAIIFLSERLNFGQMLGYVLILWGNLWLGGLQSFSFSLGELMILVATILWAVENVLAKIVLRRVPSEIVAWARMFFGSIVLLGIVLWQGKAPLLFNLNYAQTLTTFISSLFLLGYVLTWYKALKYAPATVVSSILVLSTIITNLLSAIFLTHKLPQTQLVSFSLLSGGVFLITVLGVRKEILKLFLSRVKNTY